MVRGRVRTDCHKKKTQHNSDEHNRQKFRNEGTDKRPKIKLQSLIKTFFMNDLLPRLPSVKLQ